MPSNNLYGGMLCCLSPMYHIVIKPESIILGNLNVGGMSPSVPCPCWNINWTTALLVLGLMGGLLLLLVSLVLLPLISMLMSSSSSVVFLLLLMFSMLASSNPRTISSTLIVPVSLRLLSLMILLSCICC